MKMTRRELVAVAVLTPVAGMAQAPPETAKRDWLGEARESRATAVRAIAKVEVPMATEPAFRFWA